jgi:hypothetical protein
MLLLLVFLVIAVVGQAINIAICVGIDSFAPQFSFMAFFAMYLTVFWLAWNVSVRLTEPDALNSLRRRVARTGPS